MNHSILFESSSACDITVHPTYYCKDWLSSDNRTGVSIISSCINVLILFSDVRQDKHYLRTPWTTLNQFCNVPNNAFVGYNAFPRNTTFLRYIYNAFSDIILSNDPR